MNPEDITRPIMWNVGTFTKVAMYTLLVASTAVFLYGFWRRLKVWRRGRTDVAPSGTAAQNSPAARLARVARHVLVQVRIARIPVAYASHLAIFYGFIVLFIGTVLVAIEHYHLAHFFYGDFYRVASFLLDLFGLAFVIALFLAVARRGGLTRVKPSSKPIDAAILWLLIVIGVTGFLVEGLRIAALEPDFERVSFVGWGLASAFAAAGGTPDTAQSVHFALWWVHMVLVFVWIAMIPYTKLLHFLVAPYQVARTPEHRSGRLVPISMEEVEETGVVGLAKIEEFSRDRLISYDACTHCRRCESACPAFATDKPLSPMRVILDVAANGESADSLHGDVISAETLWSCTTCGACVHHCPVLIDQMGTIVDMRRHLVGEGQVLGSSQAALRSIAAQGNPWGLPPDERDAWAADLDVPRADDNSPPEILLWVGCAGSYDRRNQQVTKAVVQVLKAADVDFAILGNRERCTGDPARRLGDEFTFLEQAMANVETLNSLGAKRIVTACAHCFNTLANEYPDFDGSYDVVHHTEFIRELINAGRLKLAPGSDLERLTLHDPCYLSRHNDGAAAPRAALGALASGQLPIIEPEQHSANTFCCGAGGGRMWMEEDIDKRVNVARWNQLKQTGAKTVATACPFCMVMLDDASKEDEDAGIQVRDVAELVADHLTGS